MGIIKYIDLFSITLLTLQWQHLNKSKATLRLTTSTRRDGTSRTSQLPNSLRLSPDILRRETRSRCQTGSATTRPLASRTLLHMTQTGYTSELPQLLTKST